MSDIEEAWSAVFCPETDHDLHDPTPVRMLPLASPMQTEVEIEVRCKWCGLKGLAALELTYAHVYTLET